MPSTFITKRNRGWVTEVGVTPPEAPLFSGEKGKT